MLRIVVQHHPSRHELIGPLLERLGGMAAVVADPDPDGGVSPLRAYLAALDVAVHSDVRSADHVVVVQDDAWPVTDFPARATRAVRDRPDALVAFCVQGTASHGRVVRDAHRRSQQWARLSGTNWIPTIALCWPIGHAASYVEWARARYPVVWQSDDAPPYEYAAHVGLEVWATVPSLVEHPDVVPTLIPGKRARAGRNRARVAAVFVDD